jgi:arsenate reductase (thioredoxin)
MAEALFSRSAGDHHESRSAGSDPASEVHPGVVDAMCELDIDLSGRTPRRLAEEDAEWADVVVTMGCGDACPVIPGTRYIDWELEDPAGMPLEEVRRIRDRIGSLASELVRDLA